MRANKIILLLFIHLFFHQSCKGLEQNQQSTMTPYNHNPTNSLLGAAIGVAWYLNILIKKTLHKGARNSLLVDRIYHPVMPTASREEVDSIIPISNDSAQEYKHMVTAFTLAGIGLITTPLLLLMRENFLLTEDRARPLPAKLESLNLNLIVGTLMGAPFLYQGFNVFNAIQEKKEDERRALEYWQELTRKREEERQGRARARELKRLRAEQERLREEQAELERIQTELERARERIQEIDGLRAPEEEEEEEEIMPTPSPPTNSQIPTQPQPSELNAENSFTNIVN